MRVSSRAIFNFCAASIGWNVPNAGTVPSPASWTSSGSMLAAIIFDVEGTLVDCVPHVLAANNSRGTDALAVRSQ
jgi:hypothetical protein